MKNFIVLLVIVLAVNTATAQKCDKSPKEDTYELSGEWIKATLYHENGVVAQTGYYTLDNKLQGEWTSYDMSGSKPAVAHYNNGKKVGTWLFYQGDTMKEVTYSDSRITEVKTWKHKDSRIVSQ